MQTISFTDIAKKYPLLKDNDVDFLNRFFNREDIQYKLSEVDTDQKSNCYYVWKWFSRFFFLIITLLLLWAFMVLPTDHILLVISLVFILSLPFALFVFFFFHNRRKYSSEGKKSKTIKNSILPEFVKSIDSHMLYSDQPKYFRDSVGGLKHIGVIKDYDFIQLHEDSIAYEVDTGNGRKDILVTGCELKTSKNIRGGTSGYNETTNHCYLTKIHFMNPKLNLKTPIILGEDIFDTYWKRFFRIFIWEFCTIFIAVIGISTYRGEDFLGYADRFINVGPPALALFIGTFVLIRFLYPYLKGGDRVKLENAEFEKKFDAFSKDQAELKKLLTPTFISQLLQFVNKIDKNRVYNFYFIKNTLYIKYDFLKTYNFFQRLLGKPRYMEFSGIKGAGKNLEGYIKFYLEMKHMRSFVQDLKIFYYDKSILSQND